MAKVVITLEDIDPAQVEGMTDIVNVDFNWNPHFDIPEKGTQLDNMNSTAAQRLAVVSLKAIQDLLTKKE